jgi:putative lysine transport system permease protein
MKMNNGSEKNQKGFLPFIVNDHRFVFLGTSVLCIFALLLGVSANGTGAATPIIYLLYIVSAAWLLLSLVAGVYKLSHWEIYSESSPFVSTNALREIRYFSYLTWIASIALIVDWATSGFMKAYSVAMSSSSNPTDFTASAIYMISRSSGMLLHGIATTVELAIFGTAIAFVLALLLVFLRIQTPDRCDNYLVRFFKVLGSGFAKVYSTIIRGTPMMVQGLIIYYGIFGIFRSTGMTAGEVQEVWSFFVAGLVTLSLCSAAYMAEVLRASIEAIDPGQLEAARSLGLSQWQGMKDIVFPQGVKNAIPALSNELIINIKDSSVLSVVGVFDLMYATTSIAGIYFRQMELYVTAALIYLCLTLVASRILSGISARRGMRTRSILSTASENESVPVGGGLIAHE